MATATTQAPDITRGGAYVGLQHSVIHYSSLSSETLTPGMDGIVNVAWEPDDIADSVNVVVGSSTTVSCGATGGPHSGKLHVWSRA